MPNIIVMPEADSADTAAFKLKERVSALDLRDPHFCAQLIERMEWAVADAEEDEERASAETEAPRSASTAS